MPVLALISGDVSLHERVVASLEGTSWTVEWIQSEAIDLGGLGQDVIVLDGAHTDLGGWKSH